MINFDKIGSSSEIYQNGSILKSDFFNNPTGRLIGLRVPRWSYKNKGLIIGDAAHATVPFYGQGMNAAFEDCQIFTKLISDLKSYSWEEIFQHFQWLYCQQYQYAFLFLLLT